MKATRREEPSCSDSVEGSRQEEQTFSDGVEWKMKEAGSSHKQWHAVVAMTCSGEPSCGDFME